MENLQYKKQCKKEDKFKYCGVRQGREQDEDEDKQNDGLEHLRRQCGDREKSQLISTVHLPHKSQLRLSLKQRHPQPTSANSPNSSLSLTDIHPPKSLAENTCLLFKNLQTENQKPVLKHTK